jgi:hypothetical protein
MIAFAISRAHGLLISISTSILPVSSFLPPTWAMAERSWGDGIFGGLGLQPQIGRTGNFRPQRVGKCCPYDRFDPESAGAKTKKGNSSANRGAFISVPESLRVLFARGNAGLLGVGSHPKGGAQRFGS